MRAALTGSTGVIGRAAVIALCGAGHDVVVLARSAASAATAERLGATAVRGDVLDPASLETAFDGAEVVVSLASSVPIGLAALVPGAWRRDDRLRTDGAANVVEAARRAGVRRIVQASATHLYADQGEEWITESSPVAITSMTEPTAVAESHVQDYACESRVGVLLRFGRVVGDDPTTRGIVRAVAHRRPVALGDPEGWVHLVHTADLGSAILASLHVPSGVYNVGAMPVRRRELMQAYAEAAGVDAAHFHGPLSRLLLGGRLEPLSRSVRVCSDHFAAQSGWRATRDRLDASWLEALADRTPADVTS